WFPKFVAAHTRWAIRSSTVSGNLSTKRLFSSSNTAAHSSGARRAGKRPLLAPRAPRDLDQRSRPHQAARSTGELGATPDGPSLEHTTCCPAWWFREWPRVQFPPPAPGGEPGPPRLLRTPPRPARTRRTRSGRLPKPRRPHRLHGRRSGGGLP